MVFAEREKDGSYTYSVEDVFGAVTFVSPVRLEPDMLDALTMHVLKTRASSGTINDTIEYTFASAPTWIENEEEPVIH
ncbi:MAG: hypothetical protein RLO51_11080 [Thalassobaculum sp.]|uniref:hypothetical protein n=1 Tax=Thalassobaculum sp. TaxID=2022740 RepID=UPI0032EEEF3F